MWAALKGSKSTEFLSREREGFMIDRVDLIPQQVGLGERDVARL